MSQPMCLPIRVLALSLPALLLHGCAVLKLASLGRSYPPLDGELVAPHASAPISVVRDVYGVPHVRAASEADAWYALGVVHAHDRLFSMDLARHTAWGELAGWFGERAAQHDVFARALGLHERAAGMLAGVGPETRAMIEAYTAGVNDGAASLAALPIEYRLLDAGFDPWQPEDCLASVGLLGWTLSENLDFELAALSLRDLPAADLDALLRTDPHSPPIDGYWDTLRLVDVGGLSAPFAGFTSVVGGAPEPRAHEAAAASNNWVIGGERTASGKPIVANDPHLFQRVPSLWYAADVAGGELHVAGATVAGMPGVLIGHDERVAWGLTNVMADTADIALVERRGELGYVLEGRELQLEPVNVEVPVHDGEPVKATVYRTEIGPVITELTGTHLAVLRWTGLEIDDQLLDAVHTLDHASSVDELLSIADAPITVVSNVVAADVDGDWAWQEVGARVGRRQHTGRVPYPGSDPDHGWFGLLDDVVGERRPDRGFVVTANSRPDHPLADDISTTYVPPHRFDRITERIEAVPEHTPADSQAIQLDVREMGAYWHRDALLEGVTPTDAGKKCFALLSAWDFQASPKSPGAAVWALFHEAYVRAAIIDDIGPERTDVVMSLVGTARSPLDNGAFDRFVSDRPALVAEALATACARLETELGPDETAWSWGAIHPLALKHPFGARAPRLLKAWNMVPVPFGGSGATVAAASFSWSRDGVSAPVGGMASMRMVMPLDDLGASTFVHPGGQSGQPGSTLYASHYAQFVAGGVVTLWFDDDDVTANARWSLTLTPP